MQHSSWVLLDQLTCCSQYITTFGQLCTAYGFLGITVLHGSQQMASVFNNGEIFFLSFTFAEPLKSSLVYHSVKQLICGHWDVSLQSCFWGGLYTQELQSMIRLVQMLKVKQLMIKVQWIFFPSYIRNNEHIVTLVFFAGRRYFHLFFIILKQPFPYPPVIFQVTSKILSTVPLRTDCLSELPIKSINSC